MNEESVKFLIKSDAFFADPRLRNFIHNRSLSDLILLLSIVTQISHSIISSQIEQLLKEAHHHISDKAALLHISDYLKIFQVLVQRDDLSILSIADSPPVKQEFSLRHY